MKRLKPVPCRLEEDVVHFETVLNYSCEPFHLALAVKPIFEYEH